MKDDDALAPLADRLAKPVTPDTPLPEVTDLAPDLTLPEAQRLQRLIKLRQMAPGDRIAGYAAAFTSAGSQRLMPTLPFPLVGLMLGSQVLAEGQPFARPDGPYLIEAEIGVTLGADLAGPDTDTDAARRAIARAFVAIDIARVVPGSLTGQCSNAQMIALQKYHGGIAVAGAGRTFATDDDLAAEALTLTVDGTTRAQADGSAAMGDPVAVVAAMARRLAETGQGLCAGQTLLTGSLAPPLPLTADMSRITVAGTTLGSVTLDIV